ncbi:hypothetical protein COB21_04340 [Candidatus Aerophobetes bacterium]|uniref:Uncharacterized protein n=1 Tax=Aerophobetes bacterium TaxID=2030807 RepID=A0A2A4X323_UNCAE|nr:MAG: hypothetical protein COB21_04340 [Candidatus Aerophobetes bacterium]
MLCILDGHYNPSHFSNEVHSDEERLSYLLEVIEGRPISPNTLTPEKVLHSLGLGSLNDQEKQSIFKRLKVHLQMLYKYHPKPYKGTLHLFQSVAEPPEKSWEDLVNGNVEVTTMHGKHLSMLTQSSLQTLIQFIAKQLQ